MVIVIAVVASAVLLLLVVVVLVVIIVVVVCKRQSKDKHNFKCESYLSSIHTNRNCTLQCVGTYVFWYTHDYTINWQDVTYVL